MLDLHIHDAHFIRLVFGMPQEVVTCGRMRGELPEFWHSQFQIRRSGARRCGHERYDRPARPGVHARFEIHLERATLISISP